MCTNVQSESTDHKELFEKHRDVFAEAEYAIKQGELEFSEDEYQGLFFPAINELRYAGKHMSDFSVTGKIEDWNEAFFHCLRAKNDAYDCLIQYRMREFRMFDKQYQSLVISDTIKNYNELREQVDSVFERSGKLETDDKDVDQSKLEVNDACIEKLTTSTARRVRDYEILKDICKTLRRHRAELNKRLKKERKARTFNSVILVLTVLTLVATIAGVLIAWFR